MILGRLGVDAEVEFINSLAIDFTVSALDSRELQSAAALCSQYKALELGLADASIVVLAERHSTLHLATFDHRHFRAVRPLSGGAFELLPADLPS